MKNVVVYTIHDDLSKSWKRAENKLNAINYINFQIENSLRVGWKKEDICIITNFQHSFMGVDVIALNDEYFSGFLGSCMCKYIGVRYALNAYNDSVYLKDHDCFEITKVPGEEILGNYDFVCCGKEKKISDQSSFFSVNMIQHIDSFVNKYKNKPRGIGFMFKFGRHIKRRCQNINIVRNENFPYRFNMVGKWQLILNVFKANGVEPYVFHEKLGLEKVKEFLKHNNYNEILELYNKYSIMDLI
jgi:hypothetical protein